MEETSRNIIARKFLTTGKMAGGDVSEMAAACDREIQATARKSLPSALKLARRFVRITENTGGPMALTAFRVLARITHLSGKHSEALAAYLNARRFTHGSPLVRGRIDRALIDVYMYLGDFKKSALAARRSLMTFERLGADADLARTRVNYANLLHRRDKHRDAERLYARAADFFESSGDRLAAAKCNFNRANTLVQLFDLKQAEKLYQTSQTVYEAQQCDLDACDSRYGLAWLRMLTGRFHVALQELTACETIYREGGDTRGEILCALDRAEVYLSLGLCGDALEAARYSEKRFAKMGLRYEKSKAALFRGQAAAALGYRGEALSSLKRAREGFSKDKNFGFMGASHLLAADLSGRNATARQRNLLSARRMFSKAQLPLWSAVCDLKVTSDRHLAGPALRRLADNGAVHKVPHLYAYWQTSCGDREWNRGNISAARKHWTQAAEKLDAVRAQLPPVELRSAFGRSRDLPHRRLINMELDHDIMQAAVWSERYKTAGVWSAIQLDESTLATRRSIGDSLDTLARQIASLAHNLSATFGERRLDTAHADKALIRLQKQVREELIALENNHDHGMTSADYLARALRTASRRQPVVQLHIQERDIIAFVHDNGGISMRRYRDAVPRLRGSLRRWRFILEDELLSGYFGADGGRQEEKSLWIELGEWLWKPLEISTDRPRVLILPEGELANLPWPALIVDGQPLITRHHFILSPSIRHYQAAHDRRTLSKKIAVFRGAADNMPHAGHEIEAIRRYSGIDADIYNPARRSDWPSTGSALLWHFTGHAQLRADNPFYSFLMLDDGPLFAADFRLKRCRVNLVTLASCRSGEQIALPGEETTGLVRSLLEMGARSVIAGLWPVADKSTSLWMKAFYKGFFGGNSILEAHSRASLNVREKFPSAYHWAAFAVFGAGE